MSALTRLERLRDRFGADAARAKLACLRELDRTTLATAGQVERLHELLCFLRAYPDDAAVLVRVEAMLGRFARRSDLRRHAARLESSGIAGTPIRYRFFAPMARWLARRWPDALHLDRSEPEVAARIAAVLPLAVTQAEAAWLRASEPDGFEALDALRPRRVTDAAFLVRAIAALPGDTFTREDTADRIDAEYVLASGRATPNRTLARLARLPVTYQSAPFARGRPTLAEALAIPPRRVEQIGRAAGERVIDLAREAMVTRKRDLDAFAYGDPRDVRLVHDDAGLVFTLNGVLPERRDLIAAFYGALTLKNGVPIGYVQLDVFARTAAVSFNTFPTFRGAEAAHSFARMLVMARHVFGVSSFSIEPYQLGVDNDEAIESGAWWFYYKMGFRPRAPRVVRLMRDELARMRARSAHRSSPATLRALARAHVFYDLDATRPVGLASAASRGPIATRVLAKLRTEHGTDAIESAATIARSRLGVRDAAPMNAAERMMWQRWAPLVLAAPVGRWPRADRHALAAIIRAKAGRCEGDYIALLQKHPRIERAMIGNY